MGTYTIPTDVSNGTLLTQAMTNTLFNSSTGTLSYLRDGLVSYGLGCPPLYFMGSETFPYQTIANNTPTNITLDDFAVGLKYWTGSGIGFPFPGCGPSSLTNRIFLCHFSTYWSAGTVGHREQTLTITSSGCNPEFISNTASMRATAVGATPGGVTVIQNLLIPFVDTTAGPLLQITLSCWQNSGGALSVYPRFGLFQLPLV